MSQRKNSNKEVKELDVTMFDNVTSENLSLTIVKQVKTKKSTDNKSAIAVKLDSIDSTVSTKITKAIKSIDFLFSSIRSIILSLIASNQSLNVFDTNAIVKTLRASKKDKDLYVTLRKLSAFTYKAVKKTANNITTVNIVRAYSVKSVLRSCEVYNAISSVELTDNLIAAIEHEHELQAVKIAEKQLENCQDNCNVLINLIEQLKDTAKAEKAELTDKLINAENQLKIKQHIFDYVRLQSNRTNIK